MSLKMQDMIFFAGEEWTTFSQRGQSLALEFAKKGHRVFYLEPMLSVAKIGLSLIKRKNFLPAEVNIPNFYLMQPKLAVSSFRGSFTEKIDAKIFSFWFSMIKRQYEISNDAIIYINMPYWWNIISHVISDENHIIYDCIDECHVYSRNNRILQIMQRAEEHLVYRANTVLATASELYERIVRLKKNDVHLISNGVDTHRFIKSQYIVPSDMEHLLGPIFGFVGALFYWIDYKAFEMIARTFPDASVVLIGPTNLPEIDELVQNYSNIHYLGPKPYAEIPDYIQAFDICLNPFKIDEIGNSVNPLKLYEYLALGKPVISSATKEMINFEEYIYLYKNEQELINICQQAILEKNQNFFSKRIEFAQENSWETKTTQIQMFFIKK